LDQEGKFLANLIFEQGETETTIIKFVRNCKKQEHNFYNQLFVKIKNKNCKLIDASVYAKRVLNYANIFDADQASFILLHYEDGEIITIL
jgi:hypothetical protein